MQIHSEQLAKFEDKWTTDSLDYPTCASCGKQVGSEEADQKAEETCEPEIPLRLWRGRQRKTQELCFHIECAKKEGIL